MRGNKKIIKYKRKKKKKSYYLIIYLLISIIMMVHVYVIYICTCIEMKMN